MKVTDKDYFLEKLLVQRLSFMNKRVSHGKNFQNVILCDGKEGYGKSTLTSGCAYYQAYELRRPVLLFFDIEKLIQVALKYDDLVLIWDDAAFAALSMEGYGKVILKLIKLLLLARKKRHTYYINIQEVFRLKEPLVARAECLLHVYSRDKITLGRFGYYREEALKAMMDNWTRRKRKDYRNYITFSGTFPDCMSLIWDMDEYDALKDQAILSIGDEKKDVHRERLNDMIGRVVTMVAELGIKNGVVAKYLGIHERTIAKWRERHRKKADGEDSWAAPSPNVSSKGYILPKDLSYLNHSGEINISEQKQIKELLVGSNRSI